jgi:hypothetical protein
VALAGLGVGLASFALSAAGTREGRRRTQFYSMAALAVGASLLSALAPESAAGVLFLVAVLCSAAVTWMSALARETPKHG